VNRSRSKVLYKKALRHMVGGVNSPVRAFRSVGGNPVFMRSGAGSRIVDADGNAYVDYCMSWGALVLGHAFPAVVKAVRAAAGAGPSFGASTATLTWITA